MKLRLATQWGCSVAEVGQRLPASELPLWHAWQYIEPFGWQAMDYQFARLARRIQGVWLGEKTPDLSELLTPERDWREFDLELQQELETERLIRNMKAVMRGGPPSGE